MAVQVKHEDVEELKKWGMDLESVLEKCKFCKVPTRFWYEPKNEPCCPGCAAQRSPSDFE